MEYKITTRTIRLKKIYELRDPKRGWRTVWVIEGNWLRAHIRRGQWRRT